MLPWKQICSFYEFLVYWCCRTELIILTFMKSKLNKTSTVPPAYLHSLGGNFSWINNRSYRLKRDSKWIIPRLPSIFPKRAAVNVIFPSKSQCLKEKPSFKKYHHFVNNFIYRYCLIRREPTALTMSSFSCTLIFRSLDPL